MTVRLLFFCPFIVPKNIPPLINSFIKYFTYKNSLSQYVQFCVQ
nr:MAG TPA: hypothetical protein [Caudoviricetes sp.]DAZ29090.1 MAG TPA: hypothetical protein [Caudoviricetes sp.]